MELPPQEYLNSVLSYNPETGALTWRKREWIDKRGRHKAFRWGGRAAGHLRADGKFVMGVGGALHLSHRVIWKMVHGEEPECVDHINGDCSDNRLENLRNVSQAVNNRNVARRSDNTSGMAGVTYQKDRGVWRAYLKNKTIGRFRTKQDAMDARLEAQRKAGFTERHGQ